MATFYEVLNAPPERLLNLFYIAARGPEKEDRKQKIRRVAAKLGLRSAQVVCGLGFNRHIRNLPDIINALGFENYEQLAADRNSYFINDLYQHLSIEDILAIYKALKHQYDLIPVIQYLLTGRLANIEKRIDATVNPLVIERYKKELRTVYAEGIAQIDFAESRLTNVHSGFRALNNEVVIMVETKLMPIGDIFFRDSVLPEEKRKLISRGLVPANFVHDRLDDPATPAKEREMLQDVLPLVDKK